MNACLKGPNGPRKMDHCFWLKLHFNRIQTKTTCILISFVKWKHFQHIKQISRVKVVFESAHVTGKFWNIVRSYRMYTSDPCFMFTIVKEVSRFIVKVSER